MRAHAADSASFGVWLWVAPWSAEVYAGIQVELLSEEVLEFAAFDDPQPVVAGGEGLGGLRVPLWSGLPGVFSGDETAPARGGDNQAFVPQGG